MIYKVKIYVFKRLKNSITINCGEEYLKSLRDDMYNSQVEFLDLENVIIPKKIIKRIVIKEISHNAK